VNCPDKDTIMSKLTARFFLIVTAVALTCGTAFAQTSPKGLEPLPDIPPPPKLSNSTAPDDGEAPQITIRQEADSKVEEFRTKSGKLYAVRVTPRIGKPYLLIDPDGKGTMTNAGEINGGVKPPQWTIFEF
jgi:hypothetical protein